MTKDEATTFFDTIIRGLWGKWEPTSFETSIWLALLRTYDYKESEASLRRWYAATEKHGGKPIPGEIRKYLLVSGTIAHVRPEPRKEFGLARKEAMDKVTWLYINTGRKRPNQQIGEEAETLRKHAEELYGGEWVIIGPPEEVPDDGLRGEVALRNAEALIIAGPDTPSRRFLIRVKKLGKPEPLIEQVAKDLSVGAGPPKEKLTGTIAAEQSRALQAG